MDTVRPGDRITFIDHDFAHKQGVVTGITNEQGNLGSLVCIVETDEGARWCYTIQIVEVNGVDYDPVGSCESGPC